MIHVYPSDVMSHHVKYVYDSWSCMYANQHQPRGKELPHRDELRSQCQTLSSSNHDVKQYTHSTQYCILLQEAFEWFACHEAEKLYKSEAIDSFGNRYLLGVFENKAEAEKAFDAWNKEYEQAWVLGLWTFC